MKGNLLINIGQKKIGNQRRSMNPSIGGHKPSATLGEKELTMNSGNFYNVNTNDKEKYI